MEFRVVRLEDMPRGERFDLVLAIDCIHELPDPVGELRNIRKLLNENGILFWSEPTANRDPVGKMRANLSPYHCLTVSLATGGAGLGTIISETGARALASEAGFKHFEKLDIASAMQQLFMVGDGNGIPSRSRID